MELARCDPPVARYYLIHKRFALLGKLIDNWVEPMVYRGGIDLTREGGAISYLNMTWFCLPTFEGADRFDALLHGYQDFSRDPTPRGFARFFDTVDHEWLMRFVEYRIGDQRVLRLIRKWLKAGVMQDGVLAATEIGTPQGAVVSPLLANIYLHYVFDRWAQQWRNRQARGHVILVRYADDIFCGFKHEADATAFLAELKARMEAFALSLHPEKTRLIEFGRFAVTNRKRRGLGKPETFTFLGFTHICGWDRRGWFLLIRKTRRDRMRARLKAIKDQLRRRMHEPIPDQGRWLAQVVRGYFAYHAVPTNILSLKAFRHYVVDAWRRTLSRRSQRGRVTWEMMLRLATQWLPMPRILHPWPNDRFAVKHPRWEPSA